jgi:hypothetical protein
LEAKLQYITDAVPLKEEDVSGSTAGPYTRPHFCPTSTVFVTERAEREFLDTEKAEKKRNKRQAGL